VKGYAFPSGGYCSGGIRVIRVSDTTYDSISDNDSVFIDRDVSKLYSKWALKEHDLIISTVGSKPPTYDSLVGRVVIVGKKYEGSLLNQNAVLLRSNDKNPKTQVLLLNHLRTKKYILHIESIFRGNANQASITLNDLFSFQIALPKNIAEREAIATALSDVDALITELDRLIAKKRDIKQAATQELLTGKTRLPGFSGEWKEKRLGDLAEMFGGGTPPTSVLEYYDGKIPWVSIADMTRRGMYISETDRNLTEKGLENCAAKILPIGTVLFAEYASIGECSIGATELCTSQAILGIKPKTPLNNLFLYFSLLSKKEEIKQMGQHGTQANLNSIMVKNFKILLPPLSEQTAIVTVLSDMDTELTVLEHRRDKTKGIKQGMMQELLSGRTRLV